MTTIRFACWVLLAASLTGHEERRTEASPPSVLSEAQGTAPRAARLTLAPCAGIGAGIRCGKYEVYEDRARKSGRRIAINVVVLPAQSATPAPDPVFYFAGGPGQAVSSLAAGLAESWRRATRDIVLIDQRGTGGSNRLQCELPGSDGNLQGFLDPVYVPAAFRRCRETLERSADLTQYGSLNAIDDIEEIRLALGYGAINAVGGSGGTRTILLYMRRYPRAIRAAILTGLAPTTFRNPLHHARSSQEALDLLMQACAAESPCSEAYPRLRQEFETVLARLDRQPARVTLPGLASSGPTELVWSRAAFVDAVRVLMYASGNARQLPLLIHRAFENDFRPLTDRAVPILRGQRESIAMGLLMTIVCGEDVPRIRADEIDAETRGTFLGDGRVRQQMAACQDWPRAPLPAGYGDPVVSDIPVLLLSGRYDPVTPPRWGEDTARHLKNALHLVLPGGHGGANACTDAISRAFLESGSTRGLDTSCVAKLRLPPFVVGE